MGEPSYQTFAYGPSESQFGELRIPSGAGPFPLAHVIHGGFWRLRYDLGHMKPLCARLAERGIATWNIEYRRVGEIGGGWPGTCHDVLAAIHFAESFSELDRIEAGSATAIGFSAGGHLALWAAAQCTNLRASVSLAGLADLELAFKMNLSDGAVTEFLRDLPRNRPEACPSALEVKIPQKVVHGLDDEVVPIGIARAYATRKNLLGEDIQLTEITGCSHFDIIDPKSSSWKLVENVISDSLGKARFRR